MCRRKVRNLGARLMRTRALSVCLGDRSYMVRPLDRSPGRPPRGVAGFFKRPYRCTGEYDDRDTDSLLEVEPLSVIVPDCISYLHLAGKPNGWFSIEQRADILGTHVPLHVRSFDVFVTAGSIFDGPNGCFLPRNDRGDLCVRGLVALQGTARPQRMHARRIRDASNFSEVSHG